MPYLSAQQRQVMKLMQWVITPISLIITLKMNAGITFFIFVGSVLQWLQSTLWRQPWLRRWAGLPPMTRYDGPSGFAGGASTSSSTSASAPLTRVAPGSTWQAPRIITTTARVSSSSGSSSSSSSSSSSTTVGESNNPITMVKEGYSSVMDKARERQASAGKKAAYSKAQEYEAKRALEEDENYLRRREEERQLRELKKKRKV